MCIGFIVESEVKITAISIQKHKLHNILFLNVDREWS